MERGCGSIVPMSIIDKLINWKLYWNFLHIHRNMSMLEDLLLLSKNWSKYSYEPFFKLGEIQ